MQGAARAAPVPTLSWRGHPRDAAALELCPPLPLLPSQLLQAWRTGRRNVEKQLQPLLHPFAGSVRDNNPVFSVIYSDWVLEDLQPSQENPLRSSSSSNNPAEAVPPYLHLFACICMQAAERNISKALMTSRF